MLSLHSVSWGEGGDLQGHRPKPASHLDCQHYLKK